MMPRARARARVRARARARGVEPVEEEDGAVVNGEADDEADEQVVRRALLREAVP